MIWGRQHVGISMGFSLVRFGSSILDMDLLPSFNELMEGGPNQTKIYLTRIHLKASDVLG